MNVMTKTISRYFLLVTLAFLLVGCGHHAPAPTGSLSNPAVVRAKLNAQLKQWKGTPYQYGGLDHRGIDCSGFVYRTFQERFGIQLPRSTSQQAKVGTEISRDELLPGDLVFFKTGRGESGLHVGIYDKKGQFIHASTSKGVMRSSLNNVYWNDAYWQARRL